MLKEVKYRIYSVKSLFVLMGLLLITPCAFAQTPEWQWVSQAGGTGSDRGFNIYVDDADNSYVTGYFEDTATFDSYSLTSSGEKDIFVAKADANGIWQWAASAGGGFWLELGRSLIVDDSGNIFVTGNFGNTADFGSYSITSSGNEDIFVAKMDQNGNWLWVVGAGGTGYDMGIGLSRDDNGNLYITGGFSETANFGSHAITSSGGADPFVAKLDSEGNWLWAAGVVGSSSYDYGQGLALDEIGNPYVIGYFKETAQFGSYSITSSGSEDIFVAKINENGIWQWANKAGGTSWDFGYDITVNEAANCCVTGKFSSTASFGTSSLTSTGSYDVFVAVINENGVWQWAERAGGAGMDCGFKITVDDAENIYLTGDFKETATFGSDTFSSSGETDIFIAKVDENGVWQWAKRAGGVDYDLGYGIGLDNEANCYVTGYFKDTSLFGSHPLTSFGDSDIYLAKVFSPVSTDFEIKPDAFGLFNSPNPFHVNTTIHYSLKQAMPVFLEVYNLKGQLIETLLDENIQAGDHSFEWNCKNAPAGVYFLKLRAASEGSISKMVLMR